MRAQVVLHNGLGPLHGTLENLSQTGALVGFATAPSDAEVELELRLDDGNRWITARTVRVETAPRGGVLLGVVFDRVDAAMRASIDASISSALTAARRRPILVIDDHQQRRTELIAKLSKEGMTPLAPRTPLEAIDLLTRAQLHVSVCMLAPGFGVPSIDIASMLTDSFPWVTTTEISDDLDTTMDRVIQAWAATPVARIGAAIV